MRYISVPIHGVSVPLRHISVPLRGVGVPLRRISVPLHDAGVPLRRISVLLHGAGVPLRRISVPLRSAGVPLRRISAPLRGVGVPLRRILVRLQFSKELIFSIALVWMKKMARFQDILIPQNAFTSHLIWRSQSRCISSFCNFSQQRYGAGETQDMAISLMFQHYNH